MQKAMGSSHPVFFDEALIVVLTDPVPQTFTMVTTLFVASGHYSGQASYYGYSCTRSSTSLRLQGQALVNKQTIHKVLSDCVITETKIGIFVSSVHLLVLYTCTSKPFHQLLHRPVKPPQICQKVHFCYKTG